MPRENSQATEERNHELYFGGVSDKSIAATEKMCASIAIDEILNSYNILESLAIYGNFNALILYRNALTTLDMKNLMLNDGNDDAINAEYTDHVVKSHMLLEKSIGLGNIRAVETVALDYYLPPNGIKKNLSKSLGYYIALIL